MSLLLSSRSTTERRRRADLAPRRFSFAGKVTLGFAVLLALMAAVAATISFFDYSPRVVFLGTLLVGISLGAWWIQRMLSPLDRIVRGVSDGIRSFRDGDFSVRLAYRRRDELGLLVELYNEVGEVLRQERTTVRQRQLLLQTALDRSPAAILLLNAIDRVIYSNRQARALLMGGGNLNGLDFGEVRAGLPAEMRQMLTDELDGLFTLPDSDPPETFLLSQRTFRLNRRRHRLVLLRRMTGDLGRQEAEAWKKVIRVISHELNNSLAPVSSLIHSASVIAKEPRHAERSDEVFRLIRERLDHLQGFIADYARFARLPKPRREEVVWQELVDSIGEYPSVQVVGPLPRQPGYFDPAQIRQLLINLFKNATEAGVGVDSGFEGNGPPPVELVVTPAPPTGVWIQVRDRGRGMDAETLEHALLPFYSTKKTGSGLGLALCREIVEEHGGKISLQSAEGKGTVVTCWLPDRPD
ncbi:MAG: ATP-binding protein [Acidobacteriota bacterium]